MLLLSIVELSGIPDYSAVYQACGFEIKQVRSMRAALAEIKKTQPDVIAAQFIYSPTYGSQLSNFETLFAAIQCQSPNSKLIAYLHQDNIAHLQTVAKQGRIYSEFTYPVDTQSLRVCLQKIQA